MISSICIIDIQLGGIISIAYRVHICRGIRRFRFRMECPGMSPKEKLEEFGWPSSVLPENFGTNVDNAAFRGHCPEGQEPQTIPRAFFGSPATPSYNNGFFTVVAGIRLRQERMTPHE